MQKTLDLSIELNTSAWNGYPAMPLPGSGLYKKALEKGYDIPKEYSGYSFHSYDTVPLPTDKLEPKEILEFRDKAFTKYHTNENFLDRVEKKFGEIAVNNILEMTKIKLKRRLIEENIF